MHFVRLLREDWDEFQNGMYDVSEGTLGAEDMSACGLHDTRRKLLVAREKKPLVPRGRMH